jgi:hypothetical protein
MNASDVTNQPNQAGVDVIITKYQQLPHRRKRKIAFS